MRRKAATKAGLTSESGKAKDDFAATKKSKAADEKTTAEMNSIHGQKTEAFVRNQEVRKQELAALNKAIEIISAPNVADSYAGHVNLAQTPSFLQTQSTSQRVAIKQRAADLLQCLVFCSHLLQSFFASKPYSLVARCSLQPTHSCKFKVQLGP